MRDRVVNIDAEHAPRVLSAAEKARRLVTTSARGANDATFAALNARSTGLELTFEVVDRLDPAHPQTHAIALGTAGLFNVDNALAAIACARLLGVGYDASRAVLLMYACPAAWKSWRRPTSMLSPSSTMP